MSDSTDTPPTTHEGKEKARPAKSLVVVNTGDGKGKSTAAFGVVMRAVAREWRVAVVQFLKSGAWHVGEEQTARRLGVDWWAIGEGFTWESDDLDVDQAVARAAWQHARSVIAAGEHRLVVLVAGLDAQCDQPARRAVRPRRVLLHCDDLGAGRQRVASKHLAQQHQAPVEEVAEPALGRHRRLPDGDVADQVGVHERLAGPGHRPAERRVKGKQHAVAGDRLVDRGVSPGEGEAGRLEDGTGLEVLEVGASDLHSATDAHRTSSR